MNFAHWLEADGLRYEEGDPRFPSNVYGVTGEPLGRDWEIHTDGLHRFRTTVESIDVIAYHPDSDWGPTHEKHPMVNRTLVGGTKIDNSSGVHREADHIVGFQP